MTFLLNPDSRKFIILEEYNTIEIYLVFNLLLNSLPKYISSNSVTEKIEQKSFTHFWTEGFISIQSCKLPTLIDQFTYLGSNISSTESDVNICLVKSWTHIDNLSILCKSDLSNKIKWDFFQTVAVSILLYGWTPWTLTKNLENAWEELHKSATYCFEQILEAIPHKT